LFVAVTVKVYDVPFTSPVTFIGLAVPVNAVTLLELAGDIVTVYPVMALPPFEEGGEKVTVA